MQPDYYDILEISHLADLEEIKQAVQTKVNEMKSVFGFTVLSYADAQARLNEIEEAFETLSQPETRAAYDSQWQPAKSPRPRSPPIPRHAKMDDVVIKQKSASSLDRNESQVSPYRPSTVSLIDAGTNTKKIELAEYQTRLLAFRDDVLFPFVSVFLLFLFAFVIHPEIFAGHSSAHSYGELDLVPVPFQIGKGLVFIGVIMLNLVLLYRYGQTFGKRQYSIKIVNADGSRAGLGILLVRILVSWGILLIAFILLNKGLTPPGSPPFVIIAFPIAALNPLLIQYKKYRQGLHDMIANTIVVKVFPGQNDAPYGSLTDAIGISLLCVAPFLLILYY